PERVETVAVHDGGRPRAAGVRDVDVRAIVAVGPDRAAVRGAETVDTFRAQRGPTRLRVHGVGRGLDAIHDVDPAARHRGAGIALADRLAPDDGRAVLRKLRGEALLLPDGVALLSQPLRPLAGDHG